MNWLLQQQGKRLRPWRDSLCFDSLYRRGRGGGFWFDLASLPNKPFFLSVFYYTEWGVRSEEWVVSEGALWAKKRSVFSGNWLLCKLGVTFTPLNSILDTHSINLKRVPTTTILLTTGCWDNVKAVFCLTLPLSLWARLGSWFLFSCSNRFSFLLSCAQLSQQYELQKWKVLFWWLLRLP